MKLRKGIGGGFLNFTTQEVMKAEEEEIEKRWIKIPEYSMAHVRQMYIQKLEIEKRCTITEYGLNNYSKFAVDHKDDRNQAEYISKCHWFCEDNRCEEDFWDFYDSYTLPITQKWCNNMGIVYKTE